jgi:uncharacterized membrane protein
MVHNRPSLEKNVGFLIIFLLALFTYIAQFVLRSFDDNRLTNWLWAFQTVDAASIFLIFMAGLIPAFFIARFTPPVRLYPVILFLTAFGSAAFFWKEQEVIVDSSRYFTQAKHLELYGPAYFVREWGKDIYAWTDMPLIPFLYGLVFRVFGEARIYIQILTMTFFSLSAVLTYELGKTLWDEDTGFFAGVFLLGMPYLLTQVPLMLVDVPAMFFLLLAVVAFIGAIEKGTVWRIITASVSIALAFFTKYSIWLMLSVLAVVFITYIMREAGCGSQEPGVKTEKLKTFFFRGALVVLFAALLIGSVFLYKFDVFREQMRLLIDYQKPGLSRWQESFVSTFFFQIHPFITLAALYSAYRAVRRRDLKYAVIVWLVLLVLLMQIKRIRYIIMVFPMLALMAAYGIQEIRERRVKSFFVLTAFISSLIVSVFVYLPFLQSLSTINFKDAGSFVNTLEEANIEVFTLMPEDPVMNPAVSVPLLDLFTKKNIIYTYNSEDFLQPRETVEKSSLRFTWGYRNPQYYGVNRHADTDRAVVVISEGPDDVLPEGLRQQIDSYRLSAVFKTHDDIFSYSPRVKVYQKTELENRK